MEIVEIAFESLGIREFGLIPSQKLMLLSEMQLNGIVIDLGHEMTQIVPILDGQVSYGQIKSYPVGGSFVDAMIQKHVERNPSILYDE